MVSGHSEKERLPQNKCFFFFFFFFFFADIKVFYSTLRYRRLWTRCVSFLTICFEGHKNCHLILGTNRCNIIFIYYIQLRHIDIMCLLYVDVIDALFSFLHFIIIIIFFFLQVMKLAKSQQLVCILLFIDTP